MRLYLLFCLAPLLTACGSKHDVSINQTYPTGARVKFVHAVVDGPAVNVFANDTKLNGTALTYGTVFPTEYSVIAPGAATLKVSTVASGTVAEATILSAPFTFESEKYYSVIATGAASGTVATPSTLVLTDDLNVPDPSKNYIRVLNLVINGPAIDLGIGTGDALLTNVARNTASDYIAVDPNAATAPYSFQVRTTGTRTLVAPALAFNTLNRGRKITLVVRGAVGRTGAPAPTVGSYTVR